MLGVALRTLTRKFSFDRRFGHGWRPLWLWAHSVTRTISPTYDIHALYAKVSSLANKATWISHALEFKKIFTMPSSGDIFQYHAELIEQIKLVKSQGESLGLTASVPPWMEQCLLLIAAWQLPQYRKIALDFTMDDKSISIESLVKELEKQRLLTTHLNQSGSGGKGERIRSERDDTRAHVASASGIKYCFGFQRGSCTRGNHCPFLHEKDPNKTESKSERGGRPQSRMSKESVPKKGSQKKSDTPRTTPGGSRGAGGKGRRKNTSSTKQGSCFKCGNPSHLAPECKFEGKCDYCKKDGHKQSVCKKKVYDETHSRVARVADDSVVIVRASRVSFDEATASTWSQIDLDQFPGNQSFVPLVSQDVPTPPEEDEILRVEDEVLRVEDEVLHVEDGSSSDDHGEMLEAQVYDYPTHLEDLPDEGEEVVLIRMVKLEDDMPDAQEEPLTPHRCPSNKANGTSRPIKKVLKQLDVQECKRAHKNRLRIKQYQRRDEIESDLSRWWRRMAIIYGVWLATSEISEIEQDFKRESERRIQIGLEKMRVIQGSSADIYLRLHAEAHCKYLFNRWQGAVCRARAQFTEEVIQSNVLIAQEQSPEKVTLNYSNTRWCVDSGANRDICREVCMAEGREVPKKLVIGEAGRGHSFLSEAEGPIPIAAKGKALPLLSRTIFAKRIHENILSVSEAVDKGYTMVFNQSGVHLLESKNVTLRGAPVLSGVRDKRSRLFYFDINPPEDVKVQGALITSELAGVDHQVDHGVDHVEDGLILYTGAAKVYPMHLLPVVSPINYPKVEGSGEVMELSGEGITDAIANLSRTYHELKSDFEIWHPRMGHVNPRMAIVAKPDLKEWPKKCFCESCTRGKFHRHPHSGSRPTADKLPWKPGEYYTCDLFGPLLRTMGGARYVAFYIDLKSRFVYSKPLQAKNDHYTAFAEVIRDSKARSGNDMRFFKSDGDGIFTGKEALAIYEQFSIRHIQSAPGDSASNDIAERTIRTLAELTCTNLLHGGTS